MTGFNPRGVSEEQAGQHCCDAMRRAINHECAVHPDPFDCPDALIAYSPKFDEYGIIVHDGGTAVSHIDFCPWCGARLPESERDRWFDELDVRGFSDPWEQEIPAEYRDHRWRTAGAERVDAADESAGSE